MKISNFEQFSADMLDALPLQNTKISPHKWEIFLRKYFSNDEYNHINRHVMNDLVFFKKNDPASVNYTWDQILSIRRGMIAIATHRIFQQILTENPELLFDIELLAKYIQTATNVEIHPMAQFGSGFAIDHGHGTVIGATTIAGDEIFIYHGVTLGATGNKSKNGRRHPKIGSNIFLGNGAQILGPSILENNIKISSDTMVLDSYIESDVTVSPSVLVSKVRIPRGYHIFGYDPQTRKYISRHSAKNEIEILEFEKIDIRNFE